MRPTSAPSVPRTWYRSPRPGRPLQTPPPTPKWEPAQPIFPALPIPKRPARALSRGCGLFAGSSPEQSSIVPILVVADAMRNLRRSVPMAC